MKPPLPPYFNISPDTDLAGPARTASFADLAAACAEGAGDRAAQNPRQTPAPALRRFSVWEITRYLIPVASGHFRRVLRLNPDLPQGQADRDGETPEGGAKWFTLDEVAQLRAHFAAQGSKAKTYLPYRPAGRPAKIVALTNVAAGVGKTTTCAHLAMSAALDGYRVLVIDLDSKGALTALFGGRIADEWQTVFPLLARHHATHLRRDNQARMDRGEAPLAIDDRLNRALNTASRDLIRTTPWPGIDLIGAGMDLSLAEFQIPAWRMQARSWKPWEALSDRLAEDGILDSYDIVFVDTAPALGHLTVAGLAAADILLVPVGASAEDPQRTGRFFGLLHAVFRAIEDSENTAARALGRPEMAFGWDAVRAVITRFDPARQGETARGMQARLGQGLAPHRQEETAMIGARGVAQAIYEIDYRSFNRETYARGRESFDATYADFKRLLTGVWRRDVQAAQGG